MQEKSEDFTIGRLHLRPKYPLIGYCFFERPGTERWVHMNKQDTLLVLIALSGELPADLAEFVIGSPSYTAAVLTRFKQEGYILVRNKSGYKGYVLRAKGKRYVLAKFGEDTEIFLQGAAETNHVKGEIEKRLRLHRMSKVWVFFWKTGIPIFRSEKPELFQEALEDGRGQTAYFGSQEFKGRTDAIKGSRACGILLAGESGYIVYHSLTQRMRWAKKMERAMKSFAEKESMKGGRLRRFDAVVMGDTIEFLNELLISDGGIKGNLFQIDDIYEHYYYVPGILEAGIQVQLLTDAGKRKRLYQFLCTALKETAGTEYRLWAGADESGNPVYFCYELDMRRLLGIRQELAWKRKGSIFCFSYQRPVLELFFGKGVSYREMMVNRVLEFLSQEETSFSYAADDGGGV